jgi:hypothetical protein
MTEQVLKNVGIILNGFNLSGNMNNVTINHTAEIHDKTVFGSSWRKRLSGLKSVDISGSGFWNSSGGVAGTTHGKGKPDPVIWPEIGASSNVMSILPEGTAIDKKAYFTKGLEGEYSQSGSIGDMLGFTMAYQGDGKALAKGKVIRATTFSTGTTPPVSTSLGFGSTSAQKVYAAIHLFTSTGGERRVSVQSASASNFGGASTILAWSQSQCDSSSIGTAKYGSTKPASTKHQFYRVVVATTPGSTDTVFTGIAVAGYVTN